MKDIQPVQSTEKHLRGRSLHEWLKEHTFSVLEAVQILKHAAEALELLHNDGVVYKQITPWCLFWSAETEALTLLQPTIGRETKSGSDWLFRASGTESSLMYVSPEQTGRVNQSVDHRSDLYSLGAVGWHLLVGHPPFQAAEPQALIHAHLASLPAAPHNHREEVPTLLSEMVLKLLAKRPEERYQTARSLKLDLQRLFDALTKGEAIDFVLGQHDQFLSSLESSSLYGRKQEQEKLRDALFQAQEGSLSFVLVRGPAGIGKTLLVESLVEPTYRCRGQFAQGHFELLRRESPYQAFQEALRSLFQQILAKDSPRLLYWRTRITQSLGGTGTVLVPMIPELGYLLHDVSEVVELPPQENRIRMQIAFGALFRALASPQHPLVLFLDDLQRADEASLNLIEFLVTDQKLKGLVLVGGFRDSEEALSPSLNDFLQVVEHRDIAVLSISLPPLDVGELRLMLSDLCHCPVEKVEPLAALLLEKTAGNPFFVKAFLRQIYRKGLLWWNVEGWGWDKEAIQNLELPDNVVSLLLPILKQQSDEIQKMLQIAACLGRQFTASDLAVLTGLCDEWIRADLLRCVHQHLLSCVEEESYHFVHARVQEAAYHLMSEAERANTHLLVGQFLLEHKQVEESEVLYDAIGHLQSSQVHQLDKADRVKFAQLSRKAAERAQRDGAFENAFDMLDWGTHLLGEERWVEHYELTRSLVSLIVEVGVACRRPEQVERYIEELLAQGRTLVDQLPGWKSRILRLTGEHKMAEALDVVNHLFRLTGTPLIQQQSPPRLLWELAKTFWMIGRRTPEELVDLPEVKDPLIRGILDLQIQSSVAYSVHNPDLALTMILRDVQGALQYGVTGPNIQCWTGMGALMSTLFNRVDLGNRYGELAKAQLKRIQRPDLNPSIEFFALAVLNAWTSSFRELGVGFQVIARRALKVGNLVFHNVAVALRIICLYRAGFPMAKVASELLEHKQDLEHYLYDLNRNFNRAFEYYVEVLQAKSHPQSIQMVEADESEPNGILTKWVCPTLELHLCLLFGQERRAFEIALEPNDFFKSPAGILYIGGYITYALVALYHGLEMGWKTRWKCRDVLRYSTRQLHRWANHRMDTRGYHLSWVKAGKLRSQQKGFLALEKYDDAFEQAKQLGVLHDAAMIAEHAASLCESIDHHGMALHFRREAVRCYQQWGATAKVNQLQQQDAQLLQEHIVMSLPLPVEVETDNLSTDEQLKQFDLEAVLQTSLALSRESDRQTLFSRLMCLVMEHAGAERGMLFLHRRMEWHLVAQSKRTEDEVELPDLLINMDDESELMSTAMLRYTILSHEPVVLKDASLQGPFVRDSYVVTQKPRSVLCLPILLQGHLIGLLYLENRLTAGVFTQQRQEILNLIAVQTAVSLEVLQNIKSGEVIPPQPADSLSSSDSSQRPLHRTLDEPLLQMPAVSFEEFSQPSNIQAVGDWYVVREMARGGMAILYEVYNKFTNQRAALKLMLPGHHDQGQRSRRFQRESRLLDDFNHPNIVSLLDSDTDATHGPFIVLEYLEGENVQAVFERYAPVPLGWWLSLSEQLCDALAVIHGKGVLHRDLKPSNLFVSPGEPFPHLTLLDFGIADDSAMAAETRITSTGAIVGTPAYLAPEQLKAKEPITAATDIYALGVLWFEALTGRHPMGGGSSIELFVKILQKEPRPLGTLRPEFEGSALEDVLLQLLNKSPQQRPCQVEQVWDELSMSCQFIEDPNDTEENYPKIKKST